MKRWGRAAWFLLSIAAHAGTPAWLGACLQLPRHPDHRITFLTRGDWITFLPDGRVRRHQRVAIRLEQERGRAEMNYSINYQREVTRFDVVKAWVVSPGGKSSALGRSDFLDLAVDPTHQSWNQIRYLSVAGGDRIEVGGTLGIELSWQTEAGPFDQQIDFSPRHFTAQQIVSITPAPGESVVWRDLEGTLVPRPTIRPDGTVEWLKVDNEAPQEGQLPSDYLATPSILAARASSQSTATWSGAARTEAANIRPFLALTPELSARAASLVAGRTDRWARIRALTEFVQRQIVYLQVSDSTDVMCGIRPRSPDEVMASRFGDCKDKATLMVALLRALGDDGRVLILNAYLPRLADPQWPSLLFNHAILAIPDAGAPAEWPRIDAGPLGKMIVFDPTHPTIPLGDLPPGDQGGYGLVVDENRGQLVKLPVEDGASQALQVRLRSFLSDDGSAAAAGDFVFHGNAGAEFYFRRNHARRAATDDILLALARHVTGAARDLKWDDQWDAEAATYHIHLDYAVDHFSRAIGGNLLAVPLQMTPGVSGFKEWTSEAPGVAWLHAAPLDYEVRFALPRGYVVEELPENWYHHGPSVSSRLTYRSEAGVVIFRNEYWIKPGFYNHDQYEALRKFLVRVHAAEERPLLIRRLEPIAPPHV